MNSLNKNHHPDQKSNPKNGDFNFTNNKGKVSKVILWTLILCLMVMMMVIIGGVTRLTGSGLSIVEWKPLMGAIPPLNIEEWMEVFAKYQASPQYKLVNQGMSLSEFRWIYFWEYFHRLMGRLMGIVFFGPWLFFWKQKYISNKMAFKFFLGFLLGGLQGAMGWIMVASGLVDQPHVSHFRLAAHLLLAFFILSYFWRLIWELNESSISEVPSPSSLEQKSHPKCTHPLNKMLTFMLGLLILQIFYGALVAGLRAGFIANTFPDMQGSFFPLGGWVLTPSWINIFENPLTVQWVHRMLGWSLFISALIIYFRSRFFSKAANSSEWSSTSTSTYQRPLLVLVVLLLLQFLMGVLTLLLKVPLPLAVLHQIGAAVVMLYLLWLRWLVLSQANDSRFNSLK